VFFTQNETASGSERARLLVLVSVFLFWVAHYIYLPTLPQYVQDKTSSLTQVGIVLAMYGLWQAVIRLPVGIVTDRLGRRKIFILGGITLAGIGALVLALAETFPFLVVGRSMVGLSMGAWVLQVVFFGSLFPNDQVIKAGAVLTLSSSLAKLAGTFITGYLHSWGGYLLPFLAATVAAVFSVLFFLRVPEKAPDGERSAPPPILKVLGNRKVLLVSVLGAVNQFLNFGVVFGFFPIKAGMMGASDVMKSYLLSTNILFLIGGNLLSTYLGKKKNSLQLLILSYLFYSVGITMIPLVGNLGWMFPFQAMLGVAHGISYPVLIGLCIEDIPENGRATAMGLHQSLYAVGMFLGPWIAGTLADGIGIDSTFLVMGGGTFLVSFLVVLILKKTFSGAH